jgi:Fe-S-cluster-containing hydrogenase component 2
MRANYGYTDGSGEWYITIDTNKCDGCRACEEACPEGCFIVEMDDYDEEVAMVTEEQRKKIKYSCGPCKPVGEEHVEPCHEACPHGAIEHSW